MAASPGGRSCGAAGEGILADCLEERVIVREIYELAIEALDSKGKAQHFWFRDSPNTRLARSVRMLELLTDVLKRAAQARRRTRADIPLRRL